MSRIDTKQMTALDERLRILIEMGRGILLRAEGVGGYLVDVRMPQLIQIDEKGKFVGQVDKKDAQITEICRIEQNYSQRDYIESILKVANG